MPSLDAALRRARLRIDPIDAELLLLHVLSRPRAWLFAHGDAALHANDADRFDALLARREAGEPVAYLTGSRGFWSLDLAVTPATLIPRVETELLVEWALSLLPTDADIDVADLGTGSGAIALAIARERPQARVVAVDISHDALEVARANARTHGIGNVAFRHGDWLAPLGTARFDLIVGNPPYIRDDDPHLDQGALPFEPRGALASGADGLDAIRRIARDAPRHLAAGGWLGLEHGADQGDAVRRVLHHAGFADIATRRDLEHRDRITIARHSP